MENQIETKVDGYLGGNRKIGGKFEWERVKEVLTETMTNLRFRQLDLENMPVSIYYYDLGTDLLIPLLDAIGLSEADFYKIYTNSDIDHLIILIGQNVQQISAPGITKQQSAQQHGELVLNLIDYKTIELIRKTNILEEIRKSNHLHPVIKKYEKDEVK